MHARCAWMVMRCVFRRVNLGGNYFRYRYFTGLGGEPQTETLLHDERHKGDVGAVNQLVCCPLPWFPSPAGAWELGHVWLYIKPFHYIQDPGKALCDLASVAIYPSRDCTHTHTSPPKTHVSKCILPHTHSILSHIYFPSGAKDSRRQSWG